MIWSNFVSFVSSGTRDGIFGAVVGGWLRIHTEVQYERMTKQTDCSVRSSNRTKLRTKQITAALAGGNSCLDRRGYGGGRYHDDDKLAEGVGWGGAEEFSLI